MSTKTIGGIVSDFIHCQSVAKGNRASLFRILASIGFRFYYLASENEHPDPEAELDCDGHLLEGLTIQHQLLCPDRNQHEFRRQSGSATLQFLSDTSQILISQSANYIPDSMVDHLALGQLSLACTLYPHLNPDFAWIDEPGANTPSGDHISRTQLPYLFWATYLGPNYVDLWGLDFVNAAPAWRVVNFSNGGVLLVATPSYLTWWESDPSQLLHYFRRRCPLIVKYIATEIPGYS